MKKLILVFCLALIFSVSNASSCYYSSTNCNQSECERNYYEDIGGELRLTHSQHWGLAELPPPTDYGCEPLSLSPLLLTWSSITSSISNEVFADNFSHLIKYDLKSKRYYYHVEDQSSYVVESIRKMIFERRTAVNMMLVKNNDESCYYIEECNDNDCRRDYYVLGGGNPWMGEQTWQCEELPPPVIGGCENRSGG